MTDLAVSLNTAATVYFLNYTNKNIKNMKIKK